MKKLITYLFIFILLVGITANAGTLYLVSGGTGQQGSGWSGQTAGNTGFTTVTPVALGGTALNAWYLATTFNSGDAVWILNGTYTLTGAIVIKANGPMYGGFYGNETSNAISTGRQLKTSPVGNWDLLYPTVIDGNNLYQGFTGGASSMFIDGLTIQNCKYTGATGGSAAGITANSATTIQNCIVTNCTTSGSVSGGATSAVSLTAGSRMLNSYIHDNTFSGGGSGSSSGGAVSVIGHASTAGVNVINGCKITSNIANTGNYYSGGLFVYNGIANGLANTTISNSIISNNTTTGSGGGVCVYYGNVANTSATTPLVIIGCTIDGNTATLSNGGGGLYLKNSNTSTNNNVTVQNCTITNNKAASGTTSYHGGALYSGANVTVNNCVMASNVGLEALNIVNTSGVIATVQNCTFANNTDAAASPAIVKAFYCNIPVSASIFTNTIFYNATSTPISASTGALPVMTYCGFDNSVTSTSAPYNGSGNIKTINSGTFVNSTSDYHLVFNSTAIDAGTTITACSPDLVGTIRPQGTKYDIGAYELIQTVPGAPTIGTVTAGNAQASVAFTAPASNGGSTILDYTVTSIPDGFNATGTTSPITVTGLTNGTAYTFTVTARNSVGSSSASSPSNSATPFPSTVTVTTDANLSNFAPTSATDVTVTSGELTIDTDASVKTITVNPSGKLTIAVGKTLTVAGAFTLHSDVTGTATMLNSGTFTGTIIAKQYLGTARNWYVSSPVDAATSPATSISRYYEYAEAGTNADLSVTGSTAYWKGLATGNTMEIGKGYIAQASAETTIQFSGTPNNGNITTTFDLTRNDTKGKGFNLVGNPYPSYIDWTKVAAANTNLDNTYYFRTKNIDDAYAFVTWNGSGNTFVNSKGGTANTTITRFIPPTQAFWVRVKSGTSTTKMHFNNGMREHRDDNGNLMKSKQMEQRTLLRLELMNGTESDETLIYTDANALNGFDSFDSPKMMNNSTVTPDFYTIVNAERLVINGLNSISDNIELPLGFSLNAAATLKLKATEMSNFPIGTRVFLRDKQQNCETELTPETEYTFSTNTATTNNESRFSLLFKTPNSTTGTNNTEKEQVSAFINEQNEIVILAKENSSYAIYNAVGQLIGSGILNSRLITHNSRLNAGVYVVKVNNQSRKVVVK